MKTIKRNLTLIALACLLLYPAIPLFKQWFWWHYFKMQQIGQKVYEL